MEDNKIMSLLTKHCPKFIKIIRRRRITTTTKQKKQNKTKKTGLNKQNIRPTLLKDSVASQEIVVAPRLYKNLFELEI